MKKLAYIFLITLLVNACECVPDINTPKEVDPAQSANVAFINADNNHMQMQIISNDIELPEKIDFKSETSTYQKVASGATYIRVNNAVTGSALLNFSVDLEIGEYYSILIYGKGKRVIPILMKDEINQQAGSIRFINVSEIDDRQLSFGSTDGKYASKLMPGSFSQELDYNGEPTEINLYENFNGGFIGSLNLSGINKYNVIAEGNSLSAISLFSVATIPKK